MRRIRSFPDDKRHALIDDIPRSTQNAIARARTDALLPAEHAVRVCDALVAVLGSEQAVDFWCEVVQDSYVDGLLEPLVDKLRNGELTHGLLDLASEAWRLSSEHCGEVVLATGTDGRVLLEARDLPPTVRASAGIQTMFAGALRAMLAFSKLSANVEIRDQNTDGSIAFALTMRSA